MAQYATREDWLEARRSGIGGSDIAAILGVSPFRGPMEVYYEKRGLLDRAEVDPEREELMDMGRELEPVVAQLYAKRSPKRYQMPKPVVVTPKQHEILTHPRFPWWLGSRDFTIAGHPHGFDTLETKNTGERFLDDWDAGGPDYYLIQLQWYVGADDASPGGVLAGLVGGNRLRVIESPRNDALITEMGYVAEEFWERVRSGDPPPADGLESTRKALRRLHPKDNGETIILPSSAVTWIEEWRRAKAEVKEAAAREEKFGNLLRQAIGDNTFGAVDGTKISWKHQSTPPELCRHCEQPARDGYDKRVLLEVGARRKRK